MGQVGYTIVAPPDVISAASTALAEVDNDALESAVNVAISNHAPGFEDQVQGPVPNSMAVAEPITRPSPAPPPPAGGGDDDFALKSGLSLLSAAVAASFVIV